MECRIDNILELKSISKKYHSKTVLRDISLVVQRGCIYGLVGENGAGKTTLIRVIAKLIKASSGKVLFNNNFKMACIIESPSLYPNLSAYDNIKYVAISSGISNKDKRIKEILKLVGLDKVGKKVKVKDFSLGMRQRLAIGLAIVEEPDLLILDEPINGLDPVGIKEVREIILALREKYRMTIIVSSHILSELDLIVDKYIIMKKGVVIKKIDKMDLEATFKGYTLLQTQSPKMAFLALKKNGIVCEADGETVKIFDEKITELIDILRQYQIEIDAIYPCRMTFEEYYLNMI